MIRTTIANAVKLSDYQPPLPSGEGWGEGIKKRFLKKTIYYVKENAF
jgi:hypothetical protein